MILIGILPMALVGSWLIYLESRSLEEQANRELTIVAQNFANRMDTFVGNLLADAQAGAALPGIYDSPEHHQQTLLHMFSAHFSSYGQVAIINPDGQIELVAKPQELININHIPSFQQVVATEKQAWVIAPALFNDNLLLHMHTPIFDDDGRFTAVLGTPVPLGNLTDILRDIDSGLAFVVDETGQVLLHPDPEQAAARTDFGQWFFDENGRPPQQSGNVTYTWQETAFTASYSPIESLGWTVIVARPESEVNIPIREATNQLAYGLLATVLIGLTLTFFFSNFITRPLRNLALAAHQFGEGDATIPLSQPNRVSSEIKILINTFSTMRTAVAEREAGLKQSESRVKALINTMPDTLLRLDQQGTILDAKLPENAPFAKATSPAIDQTLETYLHNLGDANFATEIEGTWQQTRQTNQIQLVESTFAAANQSYSIEARFVPNSEHQDETLLILRDTTDQKEAEASIRKLLSALEASSEGMAILDENQIFAYANNAYAKINGYASPNDIIGQACTKIYSSQQHHQLLNNIVPIAQKNTVWRGEFEVTKPDSSTYLQELSLTPLSTGEFVCVIRDITQRKKSEETIREAQKLDNLGLLAGGVAHDFNNLLTGILGHATIAQELSEPGTATNNQLNKLVSSATKAADLTRQLLAYAGKGVFEVKAIDLNQLIQENIGLLETALPNKAEITLDLNPNIGSVEADSGQLQQVLMNLVINAAESFHSDGGQVKIQTYAQKIGASDAVHNQPMLVGGMLLEPGNYVCLAVEDNGVGIELDKLSRIFDPFFSTKETGTGLGLSATLGIIRSHKGGIQVESNLGEGSCFIVYFRASDQEAKELVQKEMKGSTISGVALVIDDQDAILSVAEDMLTARGMKVMLANSGPKGLELFQAHHESIDVVLLDLKMPGMGGDEVFVKLKEISPGVRVIVTSGYSEQETLDYLANNQDVTFLQKPYRFRSLTETVMSILQQSQ
ncbi:response regulator [Candidatus Leptofilum sp.]|uniref:response regulator n=1 Tax=Candidatus Leptofilum sp. TaxID=3241576 RepID=UPI003B5B7DEA